MTEIDYETWLSEEQRWYLKIGCITSLPFMFLMLVLSPFDQTLNLNFSIMLIWFAMWSVTFIKVCLIHGVDFNGTN